VARHEDNTRHQPGIEFRLHLRVASNTIGWTFEVRQTDTFAQWFSDLRDREAKARIDVRIRRLSLGSPGDVKPVGSGVSEMRIDYGPGYRVYYVQQGKMLVILLAGGDKRSQNRDIKTAIGLSQTV